MTCWNPDAGKMTRHNLGEHREPSESLFACVAGAYSWLLLEEFGRRYRAGIHLLFTFGPPLVIDANCGFQFLLAFFFAAQVNQALSLDVMNIGALRIKLDGGIDGA